MRVIVNKNALQEAIENMLTEDRSIRSTRIDTIAGDVAFPDLLGDTDEDGRKEAGKNAVILDSSQSPDGKVAREQIKERKPFDFGLAEKTSVYDGKESYSKLSVQSYLQLYFQIFVFPPALSKGASFYEGEDSQESVEQDLYLPRIQLFHSDRELAMKSPETGSTSISSSAKRSSFPAVIIGLLSDPMAISGSGTGHNRFRGNS